MREAAEEALPLDMRSAASGSRDIERLWWSCGGAKHDAGAEAMRPDNNKDAKCSLDGQVVLHIAPGQLRRELPTATRPEAEPHLYGHVR